MYFNLIYVFKPYETLLLFYIVNIILDTPIYLPVYLCFILPCVIKLPSGMIFLLPYTLVFPFFCLGLLLKISLTCIFFSASAFIYFLSTRVESFVVPNQSKEGLLEALGLEAPEVLSIYP